MERTGVWLRVFVALLLAVLPPILLVVGASIFRDSLLRGLHSTVIAVLVVVAASVWAAILAIVFTRSLKDELRTLVSVAERGEPREGSELTAAHRQLVDLLRERDRQLDALAREIAAVPIDQSPDIVVTSLVSVARTVTGDPTWRAAVLTTTNSDLLAPGSYGGSDVASGREEVAELERWAAASTSDGSVEQIDGPWGAFLVVNIATTVGLSAILYTPRQGRPEPTAAERAVLALMGQHFSVAVEHAVVFARARAQALELDRLANVQSDFLRSVTHDLQTPLTSIGALATELGVDPSLSVDARADLETITHQAERLRRMVGQLLVASRLEAGAFTAQTEVFAVVPIVERTWGALRSDRPFRMEVSGDPHLAIGDPDRFEQALWAVLDNAIKYSPEHTPVSVRVQPRGGMLEIAISDRGVGMDAAAKERAFEQFYRSDTARRMAPDGSGVGLYAARGMVHAMGGAIDVVSNIGTGTTITIRVPAEASSTE